MIPMPDERDSNFVIVSKMIITLLTLLMVGLGAFSQGVKILKFRLKKSPSIGFTKERF